MTTTNDRVDHNDNADPKGSSFELIDIEVHSKSLKNIANEMAITLMRTSGSPVVTDAKDFSTCILDRNGEQLAFSGYVSFHVSTSVLGVKAVMDRNLDDLRPGDAYACNDPHTSGAVHQGDLAIVMPFFHDGELLGWGYVNEHVLDIGGSAISGFAPGAVDSYSESLAFPGTRIARNGVIDPEWEGFISNNVRSAGTVLNDLRSMLAANNAGQRRISAVVDDVGIERFTELNERAKQLSEDGMRSIISKLPDGSYDSEDWVEYDARGTQELHAVTTRVIIDGDSITMQFRGVDQTDSYINGTAPAVIGQAWATTLSMLAYEIPINQGMWRPIEFDLGPRGSIVNAQQPAPVTMSHIQTGMRVNRMLTDIFSQACALSSDPVIRSRVAGAPAQNQTYFTGFGIDRRSGAPFVSFSMGVGMPAGGPAQTTSDGQEVYAATAMTGCDLPDVEAEEMSQPGIILWRRVARDTGGAGVNRGGLGVATCISLTHSDATTAYAYSNTAFVPPKGGAGGWPGSAGSWYQLGETNVLDLLEQGTVPRESAVRGTLVDNPEQSANVRFSRGDVYAVIHGGGGGVGDPLLRETKRVADDINDGYVSLEMGEEIYGVVMRSISPDSLLREVDERATEIRRLRIRHDRIGDEPPRAVKVDRPEFSPVQRLDGQWACAYCDFDLGPNTENWRLRSHTREIEASERATKYRQHVRKHDDGDVVVVCERYCPGCASSLAADVTLSGALSAPPARLGVFDRLPSETSKA